MKINRRKVAKDYKFYKQKAFEYWETGDIHKAMVSVCACGELAYGYFCEESFGDDDLDTLLYRMGKATFTIPTIKNPQDKRVAFFDSFALDNRGITEQYLDALNYNGYEILYITSNTQFSNESKLGKLLAGYKKCSVLVLSKPNHIISSANQVAHEIAEWQTSKVFIHISPYDLLPIMLFSQYTGMLHRYFINLTDHAWWLGRNCIDTNLEFRQFGLSLSTHVRGIDKAKEALIPYYPVSQLSTGTIDNLLPKRLEGKFVIVTGGTFYKYLDADFTLLHIVQSILNINENVVLLMVGTGKAGELYKREAERKGLTNRIYLMDNTPYLLSVFKHAHLYLSSYPMTGGLMAQIAAKQGLPVVAYSAKGMDYNDLTDICYSSSFQVYDNEKSFLQEIHCLISDKKYYQKYADSFIYDEEREIKAFRETLKNILSNIYVLPEVKRYYKLNSLYKRMAKLYCDIENKYFHVYMSTIKYYNNQLQIQTDLIAQKMKNYFIRKIAALNKMAEQYKEEQNWRIVASLFAKLGQSVRIMSPYWIHGQKNIEIGNNFSSGPYLWLEAIDEYAGERYYPKISIGDNVSIQRNCHIGAINNVVIGSNVLMGSNILITDHAHGDTSKEQNVLTPVSRPLMSKGPVVVGNDVWIGDNVVILPNVSLGDGCVVGAGAVVTKSFPARSVIGGNPARLLKCIE